MISEDSPQDDWKGHPPVQGERFYIVQLGPPPTEDLCLLEDGSAVLCAIEERADARIAALSHESLEMVAHSQLSKEERKRVDEALR